MQAETTYLREKAHRCVALAREWALEALGVELMEKAAEFDESQTLTPTLQRNSKRNKRA
jgi:hypothetical protein